MKTTRYYRTILKALSVSIALTLACLTGACSDDGDDDPDLPTDTLLDFATVASNTSSGSSFTLSAPNGDEVFTLTSSSRIAEAFTPGHRVLIQYTATAGQYADSEINLYGMSDVANGGITTGSAQDNDNWASDPLTMFGCTRTGNYINISAGATITGNPAKFAIVLDAATADETYPTAHIIFKSDNLMGALKTVYGSFDISPVWKKTSVKGLNVKIHTSAGVVESTFHKSANEDIRPAE